MPFAVFAREYYPNQEYGLKAIAETKEEAEKISQYLLHKYSRTYIEEYHKFIIPKDRLFNVHVSPNLAVNSCYETDAIVTPMSRVGLVKEIDEYKEVRYSIGLSYYETVVVAENEKAAEDIAKRLVEKHIEKNGKRKRSDDRRDFDVTCRRLANAWKRVPELSIGEFLALFLSSSNSVILDEISDKDFIASIELCADFYATHEDKK